MGTEKEKELADQYMKRAHEYALPKGVLNYGSNRERFLLGQLVQLRLSTDTHREAVDRLLNEAWLVMCRIEGLEFPPGWVERYMAHVRGESDRLRGTPNCQNCSEAHTYRRGECRLFSFGSSRSS